MSTQTNPRDGNGAEIQPLSTLLSELLVAFTIEFDNEAEHQIQHWTTASRLAGERRQGVWLVSMAMWSNVMRLVPEEGIKVGELQRQARTENLQLNGMERWGYLTVAPDPADARRKPPQRDWMVRPTLRGRGAQEVWRLLTGIIEERWEERFGKKAIRNLREALADVLGGIDLVLPDYLPVTGYGLFSNILPEGSPASGQQGDDAVSGFSLPALLAKTLLAFALEFESGWKISLPVYANALRLLDEDGVPVAELPRLSGVSKEAVKFATGWLERSDCAESVANPAVRGKLIRLTTKGLLAKQACAERLALIEKRWRERFGEDKMAKLRESLQTLIDHRDGDRPSLSQGLMPYPEGWRARKPYLAQTLRVAADPVGNLPHFPMVLHRGGYPDGS